MSPRPPATPSKRPRRTQAERSAATRERLLAATVDCLAELGYQKTTTYSVEQRAGVTRGALLYHFASKNVLLVAAVEHMVQTAEDRLAADAATYPGTNLGAELTDLLWQQFTGPTFCAFLEVAIAARTEPGLRDALAESQQRLDGVCRDAARNVAGKLSGAPIDDRFTMGLELSIRFLRGAAATAMLAEDPARHDEVYREWQRIAARYFAPAAEAGRAQTGG